MAAQRENGLSMFGGIGCLPLLIQMPFFSALFFAAQYTNGVASSTFLGINLGKPSLALTLIVGVLYYIQSLPFPTLVSKMRPKSADEECNLHEPDYDS